MIRNYNPLNRDNYAWLKNGVGDATGSTTASVMKVMPMRWLFNVLLLLAIVTSTDLSAQVSVTATAGVPANTYATVSEAFAAINIGTHQGDIVLAITGNTTEPSATTALLRSNAPSSYTSVLIRPSGGDWTINSAAIPTASRGIIELRGADNVTIDGDDPATAGSRNLSIVMATTTLVGTAAVRLSSDSTTGLDGANNNTVKNCIITGGRSSATVTTVSYGINMSNYSSMTTGAYSSINTLIENNLITRAYHGIWANGASATYPNTGTIIRNNVIGSAISAENIGSRGILLTYSAVTTGSALIEGNDVRVGDYGTTGYSATVAGIEIGTVNFGVTITRNNIHDINQPSTGGYGAHGIYVTGSTNNTSSTISNNIIRDCKMVVYQTSATSTFIPNGVFFTAGATGVKFLHNTIVMGNQLGSGANFSSFAVNASVSGVVFSQFLNNILVNNSTSTSAYGFYTAATGNISAADVNNNNYFVPGGNVGYYSGAARTTFASWQSATSKDANSYNVGVVFASATDLHISAGTSTVLESAGATTATTGIIIDIDNDTRPGPVGSVNGGATNPDIGADEFDGIIPNCITPGGVTAVATDATTATLSWSAPSPAPSEGYEYEVRTSGTAGSGPAGLVASGSTLAGVLTANISGLSASTSYAVYVRSFCGGSDYSTWTLATNFATPCAATTVPYVEGFESITVAGTLPACMSASPSVTTTGKVRTYIADATGTNIALAARTGTDFAAVYWSPTVKGSVFSAPLQLTGGVSYTASVYFRTDGTAWPSVGLYYGSSATEAGISNTIASVTAAVSNGVYTKITGTFTPASSGVYFVAFQGDNTGNTAPNYVAFDDFSVDVTPTCFVPSAVTATAITTTDATINWVAPTSGTPVQYEYEVRTSGAAGSGASGLAASGTTASLTAAISGLTSATNYTIYVRTFCGGSDFSAWSDAVNFSTLCDPYAIPYNEGFESITVAGTLPVCISSFPAVSTIGKVRTYIADATGTNAALAARTGTDFASVYYLPNAKGTIISAPVQLTAGVSYTATVYFRTDSVAWPTVGLYYGTSATEAGMTNTIVAVSGAVSNGAYTPISGAFTPTATGVYYIGIQADNTANNAPNYCSFDDLSVVLTPTSISGFTPTTVCSAANETITISGASFTGATSVQFNGVDAASFVVNSDTSISAVAPSGVTAGTISVTSPLGTATSAASLTVTQSPVVNPITNGDATLCIGGIPVDLNNASPGGTWDSANDAIATVDGDGVVTAVGDGTTTITYSITDNGCTTTVSTGITVNSPVSITTSPVAQTVVTGTDSSFSIAATGSIVSYQWQVSSDDGNEVPYVDVVDDAVYSGSTTNQLSIESTPSTLNGNYYRVLIVAEGPCDLYASTGVKLNVGDTGIATDPSNVLLCSTGSGIAVFTVVASGTVDSYAWQEDQGLGFPDPSVVIVDGTFNGITYSGATTNQLTVSGVGVANSGWAYKAIVTGPANGAPSNPATLTVSQGAQITSDPSNQTVCYSGGSSVFSVVASGEVSTYLWQYSADGIAFANVVNNTPVGATYTGNTTNALTVATTAATPAAGTYFYRAIANGIAPCEPAVSNAAQLIIDNPNVQVNGSSTFICNPGGAAISLTASGAASYSWSPAAGLSATTGSSVTASPTATTTYTVTGTSDNGCVKSAQFTISVGDNFAVTATATPASVCAGGTSQLQAVTPVVDLSAANYTFSASSGTYIPLVGGTNSTATGDDGTQSSIAIGFSFAYGGSTFTQFGISTNGTIRLGATPASFTNALATNSNVIAPMWDDNHRSAGSISYLVTGSAPNRILTVQWANTSIGGGGATTNSTNNYQVQLFEGSNSIKFNYGALSPNALTASIGISSATGKYKSVTPLSPVNTSTTSSTTENTGINSVANIPSGTVYTFIPPIVPTYTYSWTSNPAGFTSAIVNPVVSINEATTFNVVVTSNIGCSTASSVSVAVQTGVEITTQPAATIAACQGTPVSISVVASGPNLAYQWRKDGVNVTGNASATTATLSIASAPVTASGSYDVLITPACGSPVTSTASVVTVNPTPTITTTTPAVSVCSGVLVAAVPLTGTPVGVTYNISGGSSVGLADQTGVTAIPAFTSIVGVATVVITPVANGCSGTPRNVSYSVRPTPAAPVIGSNTPICAGETLNLTASSVAGTGYTINSNSGVSFVNIDATGTSIGTISDDSEHNITMPAFTFAGIPYTTARVGVNGVIIFGVSTGDVGVGNAVLPTTAITAGSAFLAPYWDDLDVNIGGTVKTQTVGNLFIIQYTNTDHNLFTTGGITFQVQLDLTTGQIHYVYPDVIFGSATYDGGLTGTIGVQMTSTSAVMYSNNTASLVNGQSITFTPGLATYSWTGPNSFTSALQNPSIPNATAAASGTYTLVVSNPNGCAATAVTQNVVVNTPATYYADADGDTYGNAAVSYFGCTPPSGYVTNSTDCNDNVFAINPGKTEVLYNGVDDNCDGQLDEGFQYTSQVQAQQCGTTLSAINSFIVVTSKPNVTFHRFEVTDVETGEVQTLERYQNYFSPNMLASYNYARTYSVRVELQRNGVWLGYYGPSCLVSTPAVLAPGGAATISPSQCGNTIATISTLIATTSLPNVTGYRFRVTNGTDPLAPNQVQVIDRAQFNWFALTMLATFNYGTTYLVEVSIKTNGTYSAYGSPCAVTSPAVPLLTNCGVQIASKNTLIPTASLARVTSYRFEITNLSTGQVTTIDRTQNWFTFNNVPGFTPGAEYGVRVAVMTSGNYSPFGEGCIITAPAAARTVDTSAMFDATAYPNPFAENFMITVNTASEENFTLKVYDMTGRLIESKEADLLQMQTLQIGDRYPSGVYNVILTQGENVETLRVIKR